MAYIINPPYVIWLSLKQARSQRTIIIPSLALDCILRCVKVFLRTKKKETKINLATDLIVDRIIAKATILLLSVICSSSEVKENSRIKLK